MPPGEYSKSMSGCSAGSTLPRRQLSHKLRMLRCHAQLSVLTAARALAWSETKLRRIEAGREQISRYDVQAMCRAYGAPAELTDVLLCLARQTSAGGWWHSYRDVVSDWFDVYIGLEDAATYLSEYQSERVPGLLQTPAYARRLILTDRCAPAAEIDRRIRVKLARQELLTRPGVRYEIVLSEAALRRPVGGPEVMAAQMRRLLTAAGLPTISLRAMPSRSGIPSQIRLTPFVIFRYSTIIDGEDSVSPVVFVKGCSDTPYLDKSPEVDKYHVAFAALWASSLDELDSRDLILRLVREFEHSG